MNLAEKRQQDADYSGSSVPWRSPVFRISKPLLSKFITASREMDGSNKPTHEVCEVWL
jgi:hypothetical protein